MTGSTIGGSSAAGGAGIGRSADLRLARLHLRSGTYALARSELEALAGADRLDSDAVIDLAEVRWRTGDLAGAAEAAAAWLAEGESAGVPLLLAHVICAEAAAVRGHGAEAEAHVEAAAAGLGDRATLDAILAGIAARAAWPWEPEVAREEPPEPWESPAPEVAGAAVAGTGDPSSAAPVPPPGAAGAPPPGAAGVPHPGAPVTPAAESLVQAGAGLVRESPERAAVLLALALRADRAAADAVLAALDAADAGTTGPTGAVTPSATGAVTPGATGAAGWAEGVSTHAAGLVFVRAEALRAAGRHEEARIAYALAARLALVPAEAGPPGSPQ